MTKKLPTPKFRVGQLVEWSSQAGGQWRIKQGVVVKTIMANVPLTFHPEQLGMWRIRGAGRPRDHESYIVCIPGVDGATEYFWPRVHNLALSKRHLPVILAKKNMSLKPTAPSLKKPS